MTITESLQSQLIEFLEQDIAELKDAEEYEHVEYESDLLFAINSGYYTRNTLAEIADVLQTNLDFYLDEELHKKQYQDCTALLNQLIDVLGTNNNHYYAQVANMRRIH